MSRSSAKFVVLAVRSFSRAAASAACSVFCRRCKSVMVYGRCFSRRSFCSGPLSLLALSILRFLYGYFLADVARCVVARIIPIRSVALRMVCTSFARSACGAFNIKDLQSQKGFLIAERRRMLSRDRVIGRPGSAQKRYFARAIVIWWITALLERFLTVPKTPF